MSENSKIYAGATVNTIYTLLRAEVWKIYADFFLYKEKTKIIRMHVLLAK